MEKHYGQIVEYRVRKNGFCISDLARCTNVNRRSIYNWFNQKKLRSDVILKIGFAIKHDFAQEFPELFESNDFKTIYKLPEPDAQGIAQFDAHEHQNWKNKYLNLLERYNEMLQKETTQV
ncbi:hypothetical protein [Mucilaginibacter celer]|uniref:Uncharacterized protein n=1 Tax=Mucilaginibacter celer TaxID=2305508 RepID=A0A494VVF3_9SPHI|nr:hypothetical protein [Mucilaginibacter celer]AYL95245.1 hypothetical protein HYN43_008040 [Mucilaginibacter celer]